MTDSWPFGTDAIENDPLTALRIPVVTSFNPMWRYTAAYLGTNTDTGQDWAPPWPFASAERPTDAETQMLASYLAEHRSYWADTLGYAPKMEQRPLDIDSGWIKYGADDWGYRRVSWQYGPTFIPSPPTLRGTEHEYAKRPGPLPLDQVMDMVHHIHPKRWMDWKAAHPDIFPTAAPA